jgi:hypothetical protein
MNGDMIVNFGLGALWGFIILLLVSRFPDDAQLAAIAGLLTFVLVPVMLWLGVDREFDQETAVLVKSILWGTGIGFLALISCQVFASLIVELRS